MKKRILSFIMTVALVGSLFSNSPLVAEAGSAKNVYRNDEDYLVQKISNPTTYSGEADGLVPGGDRENSYAWSMQEMEDEYGDYIYIGSNRNILYASLGSLVGTGTSELVASLVDVITNGELYTDTNQLSFAQAVIVRYNVKTQTMETYFDSADYGYTGDYALVSGFRAAMNFKGDIYFNANGVGQSMIWRISDNNQEVPEVVYRQKGGYMRAMTVSQDGETMYLGGTDTDAEELAQTGGKALINVYSTTDGDNYTQIAGFEDFLQYEQEGYFGAGGDVWDIVEYNGSLYFTLMTNHGAIVYEAHKATDAEKSAGLANKYGWVWTDIVGETSSSIYEPGFGNVLNYAASPYVYNGDLYFITFSNAMDSIIYGAAGLMSTLMSEQPDMQKFFESMKMMDENFDNETSVFRMKADGSVQMVVGDKKNCPSNIEYVAVKQAGFNDADYSTTQYNWRAAVYGGKLYIGTFDCYAMSKYLTKLTNGDLFEMTDEEFRSQLEYTIKFLEQVLGQGSGASTYSLRKDPTMEEIELAADVYNLLMDPNAPALYSDDVEPFALPEDIKDAELDALLDALVFFRSSIDGEAVTETVSKLLNLITVHEGNIKEVSEQFEFIIAYLEQLIEATDDDGLQQILDAVSRVFESINGVLNVFENVNQEGVDCYVRVSDTIAANDNPGFELYCTEDGVNYETITLNGFNDEYNYGCRTLLVGSDGLYLGTANPFYGGQLWKINERTVGVESFTSNIESINDAFDPDTTSYTAEVPYETDKFTFTFIPADHGNTVYVNGTAIDGWDAEVALEVGKNVVTVVNEDIDGNERVEYTFEITRLDKTTKPDDTTNPGDKDDTDKDDTNKDNNSSGNKVPDTGDTANVFGYSALIAVACAVIAFFSRRRFA